MQSPVALLLVDDSDAERDLLEDILRAAFPDATIRTAFDPSKVKQICEVDSFDCVLLDYSMPALDGISLAAQLRDLDAYLPIILTTSVGHEMLVSEALRGGVSDYIPKARITMESIHRIIRRAVHDRAQARVIDEQRRELENFAFALAHDFKQPIRQIITFSQLVSDAISASATGETQQHLTFLGDAAFRLARLVDVMSQYTLLNEPPELRDVDLNDVLAAVRASLSAYLAERGGELAAPSCAPTIHGNETLMIQVLENLIVNGLKYNDSAAPRVELTAVRMGDQWAIDVRDNGIGIDAEYVTKIFDPLVRLHTGAEYSGSGLGLTLARKAILSQAGSIWCDSAPGGGSVFHLRLPAAKGLTTGMEAAPQAGAAPAHPS